MGAQSIAAAFEEQRHLEHQHRIAARLGRFKKQRPRVANFGMQDCLKTAQLGGLVENDGAKTCPVNGAAGLDPGKGTGNFGNRPAPRPEQFMYGGIGVKDGHPQVAKVLAGPCLAHADRAGETEDDHFFILATMKSRKPWLTSGSAPYHAVNPIRP